MLLWSLFREYQRANAPWWACNKNCVLAAVKKIGGEASISRTRGARISNRRRKAKLAVRIIRRGGWWHVLAQRLGFSQHFRRSSSWITTSTTHVDVKQEATQPPSFSQDKLAPCFFVASWKKFGKLFCQGGIDPMCLMHLSQESNDWLSCHRRQCVCNIPLPCDSKQCS